jgi:voltage-gated potassium channel Kch
MSQCTYKGPSGNPCAEPALDDKSLCFWHDRDADKGGDDIKERPENRARNEESMEGFELGHANLEDAYLMEANLSYANLTRVNLKDGHLFGINLKGSRLFKITLERANLKEADLEGTDLLGANLNDSDLERVTWGETLRNHKEAEALEDQGDDIGARAKYVEAEEIYRNIRQRYEDAGTTDIAGGFFYWEMVMKRKQMPFYSVLRFWSRLVDILCGYGELPHRIIGSSAGYITFNAVVYCLLGMQYGGEIFRFSMDLGFMENLTIFGYSLYFSVVTFTTLGYGDFSPATWSRPFAALEAFNGAFMIALFILAFVKKMTR